MDLNGGTLLHLAHVLPYISREGLSFLEPFRKVTHSTARFND